MAQVIVSERIKFSGDLRAFLAIVCQDFSLGDLRDYKIVEVGYEDFNIILISEKEKYFVKIFADYRNDKECQDYIDRITNCIDAGVNTPKLFEVDQNYLYLKEFEGYKFRLTVMEYIDGESFYQSKKIPSIKDKKEIIRQATLINSIDFNPPYVYDSWASVTFIKEFEKKKSI